MRRVEAIVGAISLLLATCACQAQDRCYAFILRADVFVTCEGRTTQVTHRADLEGFAVSDEQLSFAYTTSRVLKSTAMSAWSESTATVIDLKTGGSKDVKDVWGVGSTCGGIFTVRQPGIASTAVDVLRGGVLSYPPYSRFRCSSDRKTVVGTAKDLGSDLYAGIPPSVRIAGAKAAGATEFNVSPDGSKIAYFNSPFAPLCVFSAPGRVQCAENRSDMGDYLSVKNSGEALVNVATNQGCHYSTPYYFSPTWFPGATTGDDCAGIGYWRPGQKSIEIIESLGRDPQWIGPATAKLLRDWSARSNQGAK